MPAMIVAELVPGHPPVRRSLVGSTLGLGIEPAWRRVGPSKPPRFGFVFRTDSEQSRLKFSSSPVLPSSRLALIFHFLRRGVAHSDLVGRMARETRPGRSPNFFSDSPHSDV